MNQFKVKLLILALLFWRLTEPEREVVITDVVDKFGIEIRSIAYTPDIPFTLVDIYGEEVAVVNVTPEFTGGVNVLNLTGKSVAATNGVYLLETSITAMSAAGGYPPILNKSTSLYADVVVADGEDERLLVQATVTDGIIAVDAAGVIFDREQLIRHEFTIA
jgi:hypothetical protein